MTKPWDWLIGTKVTVPHPRDASSTMEGEITEVRDDHPEEDEQAIRVVVDTGDKEVDTAKDRIEIK